MHKEDRALLAEVNRILDQMKKSGELGEIYQRWKIWTPEQATLGISTGAKVAATSLAEGDTSSGGRWWPTFELLMKASLYTLLLTVLSMPLALLFGLVLAMMGRSGHLAVLAGTGVHPGRPRHAAARTDLLDLLHPAPARIPAQPGRPVHLGQLRGGRVCLSARLPACHEAGIRGAGLEAVPKGQREAAFSVGMSENQAFIHVILPQSFRIILPPVLNDLISLLKDSSLVSVIGVQELLQVAMGIGKARFDMPAMLLMAAAIYLVLSWVADLLGKRLEARLKKHGAPTVKAAAPCTPALARAAGSARGAGPANRGRKPGRSWPCRALWAFAVRMVG